MLWSYLAVAREILPRENVIHGVFLSDAMVDSVSSKFYFKIRFVNFPQTLLSLYWELALQVLYHFVTIKTNAGYSYLFKSRRIAISFFYSWHRNVCRWLRFKSKILRLFPS